MLFLVKFIIALFVVLAFYFFLGLLWRRVYSLEAGYDQIHFAQTSDGWKVALHRYSPKGETTKEYPVMLCHGLGANRFNFDLGEEVSLARFLQQEGYDVWVLELRGRGNSSRPRLFNQYRKMWTFDDYVRKDVPAAIEQVKEQTGSPKVHWVGHSMGGLVLYAFLQGERREEIASGVTIGSPGFFRPIEGFSFLPSVLKAIRILPRLHFEFLAAGLAPLMAIGKAPFSRFFLNPDNVERPVFGRAICHLVSDIHSGELRQFGDWIKSGDFRSSDAVYSYQENFQIIRAPMFLVAGSMDFLAGSESVAFVYDRISSPIKRFRIFGRAHGDRYDYGHGDLLIGKTCSQELYPAIVEWLEDVEKNIQSSERNV
jgi:pimeloyl-ACP methyl ester carboxylesterase